MWGSFWKEGKWGYKCCHSFVKNSYCCGEAGKQAVSDAEHFSRAVYRGEENEEEEEKEKEIEKKDDNHEESEKSDDSSSEEDYRSKTERKSQNEKRKEKKRKHKEKRKNKDKKEKDKLKEALEKEEKQQKEAERLLKMDERKRPYNSMYEVHEPTEEEKEAYLMKRKRDEDPMNQFML